MAPLSLRAGAPVLRLRSLQSAQLTRNIASPRALYSILSAGNPRTGNVQNTSIPTQIQYSLAATQSSAPIARTYSSDAAGKPTADLLIEELQDLYEVAKDEFEIATDSTDGATIYAASDRESSRDALNQLCAVYHLYTARPGEEVDSGVKVEAGAEKDGEAPVVETKFNPADISGEVRDEVRRRVGQRVRELRNAVEVLEERAHAE
ncbi:uncharacterized protein N7482_007440 [Penicillium canariense]|uniref:Uncharacterized protein n=1 Tax=Penicillium canariense TaxID=189055 RepID=A0A9W9HZ30_9EURO|nr:uncharacterized protein N7482_007440 [Penicillium canariense]KAJ5160436.1 hypothetical protein N7482_007440 [Penicillium canariense]